MDQNVPTAPAGPATGAPLTALRVIVLLHLAAILWEGVTAGQLVTFNLAAEPLHYFGAFGVHVAAGAQVLAAAWLWSRARRTALGLLVLSAVAFGLGFLQAALGTYGPLQVHVPLAVALMALVAWTAAMAWLRPAARA
ncbi:hypothetical protein [Nocardiopsis sp. NRRL B-16309]|uniref:hypothetical protein n=1 Tax=Nocardiopsis sp. NRRL B-16309 TaxID=1519494 RepID=UPI0006AE7278|nr:hypothetical protein [Nocardiopsis sp. NRRL B-16309]KOX19087.1 hypothetical protein ADL05_06350 [Nocardiopsis sp. NRRL B-16309]